MTVAEDGILAIEAFRSSSEPFDIVLMVRTRLFAPREFQRALALPRVKPAAGVAVCCADLAE